MKPFLALVPLLGLLFGEVIAQPQPKHSEGLLVIYNGQWMVEANAYHRGYDLSKFPNRCGISGISPAMLGRVAYVRVGNEWDGPCLVIDSVSSKDAVDSIEGRHEIAEISYEQALRLDETWVNGGRWGEVWFGLCPPDERMRLHPEPYILDRDYTHWPWRWDDFWPYPEQELPVNCN